MGCPGARRVRVRRRAATREVGCDFPWLESHGYGRLVAPRPSADRWRHSLAPVRRLRAFRLAATGEAGSRGSTRWRSRLSGVAGTGLAVGGWLRSSYGGAVHQNIAVTFARRSCCPAMSADSIDRVSTACASRFVANKGQLVANAFSFGPAVVLSTLVRSYQLCCVADSLWGRPHYFGRGREIANSPLA